MGASTSKPYQLYDYTYDENKGLFTKKDQTLIDLFNNGFQMEFEKEISIKKNNELKERSDKTTLTKSDIDLLYQLSNIEFHTNYDRSDFENIPLKDLFPGMSDNKLMVHQLMPIAKSFVDSLKNGERPIIERFDKKDIMAKFSRIYLFFSTIIVFSVIMAFILVEADIKRN